eukprot:5869299-Prymnesium_polylepis.1
MCACDTHTGHATQVLRHAAQGTPVPLHNPPHHYANPPDAHKRGCAPREAEQRSSAGEGWGACEAWRVTWRVTCLCARRVRARVPAA